MKNFFLLIGLLLFLPNMEAQDNDDDRLQIHRVDVAAGIYTSKDIFTSIQYDNGTPWGRNSKPTFFITTSFYKVRKMEVGIGLGYQQAYLEGTDFFTPDGDPIDASQIDVNYYTFLPQLRFNWVQSRDNLFEMYSVVGFALTFVSEEYTNSNHNNLYPVPGAHVTGLGLRFGNTVAGFMEVGLGSKGLMSAGISVKL